MTQKSHPKSLKRKLRGPLCAALVLGCFLVPAVAKGAVYTDCPETAWYYADVSAMTEAGLLNGNPDGTFCPDDVITTAQFAAVVCRMQGILPEQGKTWADGYLSAAVRAGFLSEWEASNPDREMTRLSAVAALISIKNLRTIEPNLYFPQDGVIFSDWTDMNLADRDCAATARLLGWVNGDAENRFLPKQPLSRAEFCTLIARILQAPNVIPEPDIVKAVHVEFLDETARARGDSALVSLMKIPPALLQKFQDDGWRVSLFTGWITDYLEEPYKSQIPYDARGMCFNNQLYVRVGAVAGDEMGTMIHEFGHYLQKTYSLPELATWYEEEADALGELLGRAYCTTSKGEFFAEACKAYVFRGYDALKTAAPKTAEVIHAIWQGAAEVT